MDWFSFHPYPESSRCRPPSRTRARRRSRSPTTASSSALLGHGVRRHRAARLDAADHLRRVRRADDRPGDKRPLYTGTEPPSAIDAVDEATQARYYREALQLAACQPNVVGSSSSTSPTRPTSTAGSPACTTRTTRRSRASRGRARGRPAARAGTLVSSCSASIRGVEGQYVAYTFFRVDPAWRRLPVEERAAGKDAFAEVVESWAERMDGAARVHVHRRPAGLRLLPLEDHRALRGPRRARRGAERDAARRLARDAVLVPRDDEGVAVHERAQAAEDHAARPAVPRRLPVREGAAVVLAVGGRPPARDGRAHPHRPRGVPRRSTTTRRTRSGSTTRSS